MSQAGRFATAASLGAVTTLTGNSGGPVPPTGGNINVVGGNNINIVGNPGTSTLTASVSGTTNHAIQLGNASGSLTSLGVATNGQLPIGSTGADPVLATITAGTGISVVNGAGTITISASGGGGGSGTPVQQARTKTSAIVSTTKSFDQSTTPTIANTDPLLSIVFTPTSATNTLIFEASFIGANVTNNTAPGIFLFAGTSCLATASVGGNSSISTVPLYFEAASGTTSATTYAIRFADPVGLGGTTSANVSSDGVNTYGGTLTCVFTITEVIT